MELSFGFRFLVYFCLCVLLVAYLIIESLRKEWRLYRKITPIKVKIRNRKKYRNLAHQYTENYHIGFFPLYPNENMLNATSVIPGCIIFKNIWCICINHEKKENEITQQAFLQTLGHELAHKDGDYSKAAYKKKIGRTLNESEIRLINWITEIHHDFKGISILKNSDNNIIEQILDYKLNVKKELGGTDKEFISHPKLLFRKECLLNRKFDRDLIVKVAMKTKCTNKELIQELHNFYGDIYLDHS